MNSSRKRLKGESEEGGGEEDEKERTIAERRREEIRREVEELPVHTHRSMSMPSNIRIRAHGIFDIAVRRAVERDRRGQRAVVGVDSSSRR